MTISSILARAGLRGASMTFVRRLSRVVRLALWPAGLVVGVATLAVARTHPDYSFAGRSATGAVAELAAGWVLIAVGLTSWARRPGSRFGALLASGGFGWFLVEWTNPAIGSQVAFAIGLALYAVCPPLVAHAALAYPGGRPSSPLDRVMLAVAYTGVVALGVLPALVYDPAAEGCVQCPQNLIHVIDGPDAFNWLGRAGIRLGLFWSVALTALLLLHLARSTPALRRLRMPVVIPALVYLGLVAGDFDHSLGRGTLSNDPTDRSLWVSQALALVSLGLGVVWNWVRARRTRATLARLVVDLAASPAPGGLQEMLARTLGDDSLRLGYPLPDGRIVDAQGQPLILEGPATSLVCEGRQVGLIAHRPGLLDDPDLAEEVTVAGRLALENERLQAELVAHLRDLRASRVRIIATGDEARRRLERDLHDGAQQRLVSVLLSLGLARRQLAPATDRSLLARLDEAEVELRSAVEELRDLAHGIFPTVLAEEGLTAAVEALVEGATVPILVVALPDQRFDPAAEAAGYAVVTQAIQRSRLSSLTVRVERHRDILWIEVEGEGDAPTDLADIEDRVGALDGRVAVERTPGGHVSIQAEIPCGS